MKDNNRPVDKAATTIEEPPTPKVAGKNKSSKYLTILVMAVVAVILGRGFLSGANYNTVKTSPTPVQVVDSTALTPNLNVELDQKPVAAAAPVAAPPPPPPPPDMDQVQKNAQAEQTRLKSPSLVYSASGVDSGVAGNSTASRGRPLSASGDPNDIFGQQAANAEVVTVTAKRETNTDYKILQGKLISAVLETAVNSDLPGMVRAVVNKDVYSDTGRYILLPRGTRLIGQYNSTVAVGQTRVMAIWTRAITPDHVDIALGSPSADSLGESGMAGKVDTHFWQVFGTSTLLSVLGAAGSSAAPVGGGNVGNTGIGVYANPYQAAVIQGVLNSSNSVLQSRINIQPTIRIPQGSVIQVFVARDLDFSTVRNYRRR